MSIYKRGGVWWADVFLGAGKRRIRKSLKTEDENLARIMEQAIVAAAKGDARRDMLLQIVDAVLPKSMQGIAVADVATWYRECVADEGRILSPKVLDQRARVVNHFAVWLEGASRVRLAQEVDTPMAFAYSTELGRRGISAKSRNAYLGDLGTVWAMLLKRGKVLENPWGRVRVQRDRSEEQSGRAFTAEELERILEAARAAGFDWEGAVLIAAYTGLRKGDVVSLKWEEVDLEAGVVRVTPGKTARHGTAVCIPIHRRLRAWLEARERCGEYVLPYRAEHANDGAPHNGDVRFSDILAAAGIVAQGVREKLSFHCLRHTFVSRLAEAGVAEDVRMRLAGHSNRTTHAVYTHDEVSARAAIEALR